MAQIVPPENTVELPARLRVHALAKLLGVTSKAVLGELATMQVPAKSAQSTVDRDTAERVQAAIAPAAPQPADPPEPATPPEPIVAPLFIAPEPVAPAPRRRRASRAAAAPGEVAPDEVTPHQPATELSAESPDAATNQVPTEPVTRPTRRRRTSKPADVETDAADSPAMDAPADDATFTDDGPDDQLGEDGQPKRRRRGRRGRGRGRGPAADSSDSRDSGDADDSGQEDGAPATDVADSAGTDGGSSQDSADSETPSADGDEDGGSRRRRRRRRRRPSGDSADGADNETPDDPPNTVVHEREPRSRRVRGAGRESSDEVQGITGSTRLEAKRQRRRDGRDVGRRRPPILSESEFLARREAVDRVMVVRQHGAQTQVAVLEDEVLVEHFVTSANSTAMGGNIYLGRVQNVLPSMEAAFIDVGRGRNGVLYAGEVDWDAAGLGGRARKIEQALHSGDSVLVQVSKDPVGQKGARLTTQISLPGRFLVYVPGGGSTGISRKLADTERKRLKEILKRIVPAEAGVIIRTASEGVSEEELARDVARLQAQWEVISTKAAEAAAAGSSQPVALYEEPDLLVKVVRDLFNEDFSGLVVAGESTWETVDSYVRHVASDLSPKVQRYTGDADVFTAYRIDEQLAKAMDRKVWLPSGGTLVIDRTEAMTVVDVNTGKFTGAGGNLEETVTRNNLEAAEEIVRQMRLRDIGGMIVVDFIDMVLESNRDLVLRRLTECLGRDRTRHQVSEVTSLGLVQMTRKRVGAGLIEEFSTPCEHCQGRGVLLQSEPVAGGGARSETAAPRRDRGGRSDRAGAASPVVLDPGPLVRTTAPVPGPKTGPVVVATEEPEAVETTPAEPAETTEQQPVRRTRARRASRPAAAPEPAPSEAAPSEPAAPTVVVAPAPALEESPKPEAVPAPPRRRRAAGRPAGPPVQESA